MIVYLARDIPQFVMYCVNGKPRSSLFIVYTDSMIIIPLPGCTVRKSLRRWKERALLDLLLAWKVLTWQHLVLEAKERALLALAGAFRKWASAVRALTSVKKRAQLWRISLALVARKLLLRLLLLILHQGPQDILGDFPEDWPETVDKDEIKSISLFYVITLCMHFPLLKLKLQSMLHP